MIEFRNVEHSFEGKMLFSGLSFSVEEGKHVCLKGGSGKGKTTLLNMVLGFEKPDKGEIVLNGMILTDKNQDGFRQQLVYLPQNVNLSAENGLELLDWMERNSIISQVKRNLDFLGLTGEFIEKPFEILSGGEKQRVLLAICFGLPGKVLVLDEPTSALDEASVNKVVEYVRKSNRTIISTSHNPIWVGQADKLIEV